LVHVADLAAFENVRLDDVKAFFFGRGEQESLWPRQIYSLHLALGGLRFGELRDSNGQRASWLFGRMPENFDFHRLARKIQRKRRTRGEFFGTVLSAFSQRVNQRDGFVARRKLRVKFRREKNPAPAIEPITQMIDFHDR